jgi:hypothetical protein
VRKSWRISVFVALGVFAIVAGALLWMILAARPTVSERWALYVEHLEPEQKLVVLSSEQRYTASKEFAAKLLSIVKVQASIELSAVADVF